MSIHQLYASRSLSLDGARRAIEMAFMGQMQEHDSAFFGHHFRLMSTEAGEFMLRENLDPDDKEPAEMAFAEFPILLYVDRPPDAEAIGRKLEMAGFQLLRSEIL